MSKQSSLSERLSRALATPVRGVLGLVDELLQVSREQDVRLGWQEGRCHIDIAKAEPSDCIDAPMQKSVIRRHWPAWRFSATSESRTPSRRTEGLVS